VVRFRSIEQTYSALLLLIFLIPTLLLHAPFIFHGVLLTSHRTQNQGQLPFISLPELLKLVTSSSAQMGSSLQFVNCSFHALIPKSTSIVWSPCGPELMLIVGSSLWRILPKYTQVTGCLISLPPLYVFSTSY